jgi:hypothetical protein
MSPTFYIPAPQSARSRLDPCAATPEHLLKPRQEASMIYLLMGYAHAAILERVRTIRALAGGERGQGTVEYVGLILLVSLLMVGMVAAMKGFNRSLNKTSNYSSQHGRDELFGRTNHAVGMFACRSPEVANSAVSLPCSVAIKRAVVDARHTDLSSPCYLIVARMRHGNFLGDWRGTRNTMSHRAALYTVEVRPKRDKEPRLLGDFDGAGTSLLEVLRGYLGVAFASANPAKTKEVRIANCRVDENEERLAVAATHGRSGLKAQIVDQAGQLQFEQATTDSQLLQCACLFWLPPTQRRGWLAIHVNNGRGIKTLLENGIQEKFRADHPGFVLQMHPYVERSVLDKAIEEDRIGKVKLVKLERPSDQAMAITNKWIPGGVVGKFELSISAKTRGEHVLPDLIRRFLSSNHVAREEIIEFEGVEFDEASVEVETDEGGQRTFNIERPEAGHAFTEDLEGLELVEGEPTHESVIQALGTALDRVS